MRNENGRGRLALIFWLLVLGAAVFAAIRIVPVKIHVMELHDFIDQQLQMEVVSSRLNEERLTTLVLEKARALEVPLERKQLKLVLIGNEARLRVTHEVHIDLAVYELVWHYDKTFVHDRIA